MIEVSISWDLLPNIDQDAYAEWGQKTAVGLLQAPGLIEFRAHRNVLGTPQARSTTVWQSLADWANYTDSDEWRANEEEIRGYATNLRVEIWGPSPVVPEPLRPS
jgi:heme-degrading monooxygenase HmoA